MTTVKDVLIYEALERNREYKEEKKKKLWQKFKVLIACEESQTICIEFRKLWIEAYSCDIQPCSWWHPERHIQWDALEEAYSGKYDLMIAHPPCTYLSNAGARHLWAWWQLNKERYTKWLEAKEFFMKLLNAPIKYIAIENPIQSKIYEIPKYNQIIQPYEHWHPFSKRTCLRLKNLPNIIPTDVVDYQSTRVVWNWFNKWWKERQKNRSKTFPWIAKAISQQRSEHMIKSENLLFS